MIKVFDLAFTQYTPALKTKPILETKVWKSLNKK